MTNTELQLLAIYRSPAIPLAEVAERYFNLSVAEAQRNAAVNALPVSTFRLRESKRAPLMISVAELAEHIDNQHNSGLESYLRSRI